MHVEIVRGAASLLQQRLEELLHDRSLPLSARGMINVHAIKPWIANFWSVAIRSPRGGGDQSYFDFPIAHTADEAPWFFPSRQWWTAHATASHPPDGSGCDVAVHTDFLSSEGATHEFDYATILTDGHLKILGRSDFVDECSWWSRAFSPRSEPQYRVTEVQHGLASWYGEPQMTASGERFDKHALTAAHKSLPLGSMARVTNIHNDRSVVVQINDRGPYSGNRIIDLSEAAARHLDMIEAGVVPVKLEVLAR